MAANTAALAAKLVTFTHNWFVALSQSLSRKSNISSSVCIFFMVLENFSRQEHGFTHKTRCMTVMFWIYVFCQNILAFKRIFTKIACKLISTLFRDFCTFHWIGPLGRFSHRVAMSVCLFVCLSVPSPCNFFSWVITALSQCNLF